MTRLCVILAIVIGCLCVADVASAADPVYQTVAGGRGNGNVLLRGLGGRRGGGGVRGLRDLRIRNDVHVRRHRNDVLNLLDIRGYDYGVRTRRLNYGVEVLGDVDGGCGCCDDQVLVRRLLIRSSRRGY